LSVLPGALRAPLANCIPGVRIEHPFRFGEGATVYAEWELENVLATAGRIGKDGAAADERRTARQIRRKSQDLALIHRMIGRETAHGCSGSEKIEVWQQRGGGSGEAR
jgi:hypothetical protein